MPRFKKPSIHELGLKTFLTSTFPEVQGTDAYELFVMLVDSGVNSTNIGKVYGRGAGAVDHWKVALKEEQKV